MHTQVAGNIQVRERVLVIGAELQLLPMIERFIAAQVAEVRQTADDIHVLQRIAAFDVGAVGNHVDAEQGDSQRNGNMPVDAVPGSGGCGLGLHSSINQVDRKRHYTPCGEDGGMT